METPKYMVFDLETTIYESFKRKANPFDNRNWVVLRGWKVKGDEQNSWKYYKDQEVSDKEYLIIPDDVELLVGFNIKFDLLYEMAKNNTSLTKFFKRGGKVWCGQYAEYLLEGQQEASQMCSMDDIIEKYGGKLKVDEVKLLWEQGVQTFDIPVDLLTDYAVGRPDENRNGGDIRNTELIFLGQWERAVKQNQMLMLEDRMDGLLSTVDMEFHGLKIDIAEVRRRLPILNKELEETEDRLSKYIPADLPFEFNWGSRAQVSCIIFGGAVKYKKKANYIDEKTGELARYKATEDWPLFDGLPLNPVDLHKDDRGLYHYSANHRVNQEQDTYLSGKRIGQGKFKKVDVEGELKERITDFLYYFPKQAEPQDDWLMKTTDGKGGPLYSTSGDIIKELGNQDVPFLKDLAKKQDLTKEIGTYYVRIDPKTSKPVGMLTCVDPKNHILHHSLNVNLTVTSRLSSSNPNMQNLPRKDKSEVKKMFVSRYGADGIMLEVDYSQLEVVVQGVLSGDVNLCRDLNNKIDFHCKRVSKKFGITYEEAVARCKDENHPEYEYWKKQRTLCKNFSFQRAYGAGAPAIAASTGLSVEEVKLLIEEEDAMYPDVPVFNANVETAVKKSAKPFQACGKDGTYKTYRRGFYQSPTGTLFSFRSWDAPEFLTQRTGELDSFSPPDIKNYPVQGTGGEFVQNRTGKLWRHLIENDYYGGRVLMVNTVHDCVWFDVHKDELKHFVPTVISIMEGIPEYYNKRFGMDITVPFPVEAEVGPNMYDLKHYHEEH